MNKVYPMVFEWLSQAEKICNELNENKEDSNDKWIAMPIVKYEGKVW